MLTLRPTVLAVALAAMTAAPSAARAEFDPTKGKVVLSDAAFVVPFDDPTDVGILGPVIVLAGGFGQPPSFLADVPVQDWLEDPVTAIEGQGVLQFGRQVTALYLGLEDAAPSLRDRRVSFAMWFQPRGALPVVEVVYTPRPLQEASEVDFFEPLARVRLHPTGRATSDGWRELSSGPVDFALHGEVEARFVQILDDRLLDQITRNVEATALLDGLSITDVGPRAVPDVACRLPDEAALCGAEGACAFGRCVDARAAYANPPLAGPVRAEYLDRLAVRTDIIAGARFAQARSPAFAATLRALNAEPSPIAFWSTFNRAFDDLGDGHVSPPSFRGFGRVGATAICLNQGIADLLPGDASDLLPMVFEVDASNPAAADLRPGDVLVAVDGESPYDWLERADRFLRYAGDPAGRTFVTVEQLPEVALLTGAILTFARCPLDDGSVCAEEELEEIEVDLAAIGAPIWRNEAFPLDVNLTCDFRFRRDVFGFDTPFRDPDFVGSADFAGGTLRSILINGVSGNQRWFSGAVSAFANLPDRVIVDQRTGRGGTFTGVATVIGPFWPDDANPLVQLAPQLRPELDAAAIDVFFNCLQDPTFNCGNFSVGGVLGPTPGRGEVPAARLAVLNGRDVSGNDYTSRLLKDRPTGVTRIFGAVPSYGAFGPIYETPRLLGERSGGSIQLQDTVFLPGPGVLGFEFTTGMGVEPDEVVFQRQSDAVRGIDTLLRAAKAWVQGDGQ